MKLGNKEPGKKVYNQLIAKVDRISGGTLPLKFELKTSDFLHLQKYLNSTESLPRILNKRHMSGLDQMSWNHKVDATTWRKIVVKRKKTV